MCAGGFGSREHGCESSTMRASARWLTWGSTQLASGNSARLLGAKSAARGWSRFLSAGSRVGLQASSEAFRYWSRLLTRSRERSWRPLLSVLGEAIVPLSGVSGWVRVPDSEGTGWAWAADRRRE